MNGEITQNPNSGEARHATRQGSRQGSEKLEKWLLTPSYRQHLASPSQQTDKLT